MKLYFVILCVVTISFSCSKNTTTTDNGGSLPAETYADVSYGADAKQKLDIYLPEGRSVTATKTIVIIHGGGWTEGDKDDMIVAADSIKKRLPAYAFININYRLASNNTSNLFPTQEDDINAAIYFYLSKAEDYKVSKDLILVGASAGGHLAMLYSYKNDVEKHVKAVVDFFGPADLVTFWNMGLQQQIALLSVTGKTYDQDPTIYIQSSPTTFITAQSPPTIALQGGADPLVPAAQSSELIAKLQEKGVANQLVYYETGGHGNWPAAVYSDAFEKIQTFVLAHVP